MFHFLILFLSCTLCCIFLYKWCHIKKAWFDLDQANTLLCDPSSHLSSSSSSSLPGTRVTMMEQSLAVMAMRYWWTWGQSQGQKNTEEVQKLHHIHVFHLFWFKQNTIRGFLLSDGPDYTAVSRLWPLDVTTDPLSPVEAEQEKSIYKLY